MGALDLRKHFGEKLKGYCKQRNIRQFALSEVLGVSRAAVSQVMHGKIMLSMAQLNKVCEVLALPAADVYELQIMLSRVRSGSDSYQTPFNRQFFSLRCQRGLSICQLSKLTGISSVKLRSFEEELDPLFTPDDAARLGMVFNVSPEELLGCANLRYNGDIAELKLRSELPAADSADFEFDSVIPVITVEQLEAWGGDGDLFEYASHNSNESISRNVKSNANLVGVTAPAARLGVGLSGSITLLLDADNKESSLQMLYTKKSGLVICEKKGRKRIPLMKNTSLKDEPKWVLSVHELILLPA